MTQKLNTLKLKEGQKMSEKELLKSMHEDVSNYIERLESSECEGIDELLEQAMELLQSIDTAQDLM